MKSHGEIQEALYDFVMNDLGPEDVEAVGLHLRACAECASAVEEMRQLVAAAPRPQQRPSDLVDEAHWAQLAARIERNLPPADPAAREQTAPGQVAREQGAPGQPAREPAFAGRHATRDIHAGRAGRARRTVQPLTPGDWIRAFFSSPRPAAALALAAVAVAVTALVAIRPWEPEEHVAQTVESAPSTQSDIAAHLRRSKNLLVGLANKQAEPDAATDLSVEREASKQLLAENRRYRSEVLDPQSSEVLADLEKIMIEVANSRDHAPAADLDLIRQGIRQQNLLFKVRMAEQLSSRGLIVRASGR
jgi:hypothetical protein